jgi:hypothetical protein
MFIQGWQGFVGIGTQTVDLATKVAPSIFQDLSEPDVSLHEVKPNKGLVPAVRGGITPRKANVKRGFKSVEGGFSAPIYPDDLFDGMIFGMLMGNNQTTSGDATDGFTHQFDEPAVELDHPQFGSTIQVLVGGTTNAKLREFLGCFLNKLTITVPEDDVITLAGEFFGRSEDLQGTLASPSFTPVSPFEAWMAKLEIGDDLGSLVPVQFTDLTFEFTKNVSMITQKLNCTRFPVGRVLSGPPEVLLNFNVKAEDNITLQNIFKNDEVKAVRLRLKHDVLAGSGAGSEYEIIIDLPRTTSLVVPDNLNNIGEIDLPVSLAAFDDGTIGYTSRITVKNSVTGAYAV